MEITLTTQGDLEIFEGQTLEGKSISLGNNGKAVGPMQSVLMAVAGCSTIDIVMILEKMKQELKDIKVTVKGTRREEIPKVFTDIHMHYILIGNIKEKKADQAIALSLEKYCSVSLMLSKAVNITSSFEIQPEKLS